MGFIGALVVGVITTRFNGDGCTDRVRQQQVEVFGGTELRPSGSAVRAAGGVAEVVK